MISSASAVSTANASSGSLHLHTGTAGSGGQARYILLGRSFGGNLSRSIERGTSDTEEAGDILVFGGTSLRNNGGNINLLTGAATGRSGEISGTTGSASINSLTMTEEQERYRFFPVALSSQHPAKLFLKVALLHKERVELYRCSLVLLQAAKVGMPS